MVDLMGEAKAYFYGGTIVLDGVDPRNTSVPTPPFRWSHGKWRTEGYHYPAIRPWLHQAGIQDTVPRWQHLDYTLYDKRQAHDYQTDALTAWQKAGMRGSIVLPTGSGKSCVAVRAIHHVNRSAVVVVPTLDLVHQLYRLLSHSMRTEIGVYYGGEKIIKPITVVTFSSFPSLMEQGNLFALLVVDELHHLSAPAYSEGAIMSPAPYRLGLTATYPSLEEEQRGEGRWRVEDLIGGPVVYQLGVDDLAGEQLATYRTERIRVELTAHERQKYEREVAHYTGFVNQRNLRRDFGAGWLNELQRLSARDRGARAALLARQRVGRLLAGCQGKMQAVDELLREHLTDKVLIFTEANTVA
jgi:superfamily II DNA or RNA helicase